MYKICQLIKKRWLIAVQHPKVCNELTNYQYFKAYRIFSSEILLLYNFLHSFDLNSSTGLSKCKRILKLHFNQNIFLKVSLLQMKCSP